MLEKLYDEFSDYELEKELPRERYQALRQAVWSIAMGNTQEQPQPRSGGRTPEKYSSKQTHQMKEILAYFDSAHRREFNRRYDSTPGKDQNLIHDLLKKYTVREIEEMIDKLFELRNNPREYRIKGVTIGSLHFFRNRLIQVLEDEEGHHLEDF